jgi:hypothetical protein
MEDSIPSPWHLSNNDALLTSPNGLYKIAYDELNEIAMGGPLTGISYLLHVNKRVLIYQFTSGPVMWNNTGDIVALPIWTKNRTQKIAVLNINTMQLTIYKKIFTVLQFTNFDNDEISGIDSPRYNAAPFLFRLNAEEVYKIKALR